MGKGLALAIVVAMGIGAAAAGAAHAACDENAWKRSDDERHDGQPRLNAEDFATPMLAYVLKDEAGRKYGDEEGGGVIAAAPRVDAASVPEAPGLARSR